MAMIRIVSQILLISIFLALMACSNFANTNLTTLTAFRVPPIPATPSSFFAPAHPTSNLTPNDTLTATTGMPLHPLLAWTLADDGAIFVLDASHTLYQLDPQNLAPLAWSEPLIPMMGSRPSPAWLYDRVRSLLDFTTLAVDETRLFVSGGAFTQTLILDRDTFAPMTTLDKTGYLALDPDRHLFLIADEVTPEGWEWRALWIYDLAHLNQAPHSLRPPPSSAPLHLGSGILDLVVDPEARLFYLHVFSSPGSAPRTSAAVNIYDLDTLTAIGCLCDDSRGYAYLSRPALAPESDRVFATADYRLISFSSRLLIFDRQGELLEGVEALSGLPTVDARGKWIYLLKKRSLWVVRGDDFSLQGVLPFTGQPPADLRLAPGGQTLYLLGNGWLTTIPTKELQALAIPPVGPGFPVAWGDFSWYGPTGLNHDGVQFAVTGSEVYHSHDTGRTWQLLPAFTYPRETPVESISISPDYADDLTLVVRSRTRQHLYRSTDGGETLAAWTPRIAFTSDRDNNREIYTMDAEGQDIRRITYNMASDEAPAWSPGWTRLAFQSDRNGSWDIYSIRADCPAFTLSNISKTEADCDLRRLTHDPADDMQPAWSPDGRYIAFVSKRDGNPEIYVMQSDGQNQIRLTLNEANDWRPAWLPNNKYLIFTSDRSGNNDLYRMEMPALSYAPFASEAYINPKQLTTDPADDRDAATGLYFFGVSPDAKMLFLSDRDGLMKTYDAVFSLYEFRPFLYSRVEQAEAHPSWDAFGERALVAREEDGMSIIYKGWSTDYIPLTDGKSFAGQPAGGPAWWRPDVNFK